MGIEMPNVSGNSTNATLQSAWWPSWGANDHHGWHHDDHHGWEDDHHHWDDDHHDWDHHWDHDWHHLQQIEMPDVSGGLDHPGPYAEEPNSTDVDNPRLANQSLDLPLATGSLEASFCNAHGTGYWCSNTTKVRCCKLPDEGGHVKCGSVVNSSSCGGAVANTGVEKNDTHATLQSSWWPSYGGDDPRRRRNWDDDHHDWDHDDYDYDRRGGGWHLHQGWHTNSYCQSHHVGRFCVSHHIIHCCNDHGHFVECNSAYTHSDWWC